MNGAKKKNNDNNKKKIEDDDNEEEEAKQTHNWPQSSKMVNLLLYLFDDIRFDYIQVEQGKQLHDYIFSKDSYCYCYRIEKQHRLFCFVYA